MPPFQVYNTDRKLSALTIHIYHPNAYMDDPLFTRITISNCIFISGLFCPSDINPITNKIYKQLEVFTY